jgi:hypothetical protein
MQVSVFSFSCFPPWHLPARRLVWRSFCEVGSPEGGGGTPETLGFDARWSL